MANCIIVFTGYFLAASIQHAYVGIRVKEWWWQWWLCLCPMWQECSFWVLCRGKHCMHYNKWEKHSLNPVWVLVCLHWCQNPKWSCQDCSPCSSRRMRSRCACWRKCWRRFAAMHQKQVAAHKAQLDWLQAFKGGLAASGDLPHGRFSTEAVLWWHLTPILWPSDREWWSLVVPWSHADLHIVKW